MDKVYLAGGFGSGWQNYVKSAVPYPWYFDPSQNGLDDPKLYTLIDVFNIEKCDIMFAYMEKSNPAGFALASEIGYAKALNKKIVFVNEVEHKYWYFTEQLCDSVTNDFHSGVRVLSQMVYTEK